MTLVNQPITQHARPLGRRIAALAIGLLGTSLLDISLRGPALNAAESAQPLVESTIMEVVNEVQVLSGETMNPQPAAPQMEFRAPDFLQTGRRSRARLEADDGTITRVGANTLFSFDQSERTINLEKGSLLFHSPTGRGGGRIVTASATASVVGTTIAVAATADGGFKLLVLEGVAEVIYPDGTVRMLEAGQMTFVLPGEKGTMVRKGSQDRAGEPGPVLNFDLERAKAGSRLLNGFKEPLSSRDRIENVGEPGPVLNFDLKRAKEGSRLLNGFKEPLSSRDRIENVIQRQQQRIASGELNATRARIVKMTKRKEVILSAENAETIETLRNATDREKTDDDTSNDNGSTDLARLNAAAAVDLTPQTDGYNRSVNFFPAPGFLIPASFADGLDGDGLAEGIIAGTINLGTGPLDLAPIRISRETGPDTYFLRAIDSINLNGDLVLDGLTGNSFIEMSALQSFNMADGSSILLSSGFESGLFLSSSATDLSLNNIDITNDDGLIDLFSESNVTLTNTWISAGSGYGFYEESTIEGGTTEAVDIISPTDGSGPYTIYIGGKSVDLNSSDVTARDVSSINADSLISVDASYIEADFIELQANQIDIDGTVFNGGTELAGGYLSLMAEDLVDISNVNLASLASVNMEARTLILSDVSFATGNNVQLGSETGLLAANPNTGASAVTGYVNFISNVLFDGMPAQDFVSTAQGGNASEFGQIQLYAIEGGSASTPEQF